MVIAIDTEQKRYSALTDNQVYMPGLYPDATIDQGDRQAISFSYAGVLAGELTVGSGSHAMNDVILLKKRRV